MRFLFLLVALPLSFVAVGNETSKRPLPEFQEIHGHVLFFAGWSNLIIDTGTEVVRASTDQGEPRLDVGDAVSVRGVLGLRDGRTTLESARYEKLDKPPREFPPIACTSDDFETRFAAGELGYGSRIRLRARLSNAVKRGWGVWDLMLSVGDTDFIAWVRDSIPPEVEDVADLNPSVEVTGVLTYDTQSDAWRRSLRLHIQDTSDVRLVRDDELLSRLSRRKRQKLWIILPVSIYTLTLVVALVFLIKLIRSRREHLRLSTIIDERKRMAADLHDTIEQHLAGASLFLDSVLPLDDSPVPENLKAVETARDILMTAKREIRETVWNLRVSELVLQRPEDVLRSLAIRTATNSTAKVRTSFSGLPESLPQGVFSDLVFLIQEATANALKHGQATHVYFVTDPTETGFRLRIANDGKPFDVSRTLIPEAGHFGLTGMRERARRSGIAISWQSNDRHTVVTLEVRT